MMDKTLPRKQGEGGVEVASRGESKTHVEPYNRGSSFAPKTGESGVEVASRRESKTHVEPYSRGPSFVPKAEGR